MLECTWYVFNYRVGVLRAHSVSGDRLYLGTGVGNLHIYDVDQGDDGQYEAKNVTTKSLGKKPIEQVDYIKDINSVVALSGKYRFRIIFNVY